MEKGTTTRTKIAPQIYATFSVTLLLLESGFHCGWSSPAVPKLLEDAITPVTPSQSSWVVSMVVIGSGVGPLIGIPMVDRWGRKTSLLLITIPYLLSCTLIAFAQNYWWYYVGRFLCGLAIGSTQQIVPMYIGEIAEDRIRGGLTIMIIVMFNLGFTVPYSAGPWVSRQVLVAIGSLFPLIHLLTFPWIPESPYYHLMKNRPEEARKSLEWFRGTTHVDEEIDRIEKLVEFQLKNKGSLKELFADKGHRKAVLINIGLFSAQQLSGVSVIAGYSTMIFTEATTEVSSSTSVIIIGVVQVVTSVLVMFLVDRAGRRTLLVLSTFFSSIFLIGHLETMWRRRAMICTQTCDSRATGEAVYFQLKANGIDVSGISWLPVTAIIGYLCSYTLGFGTVPTSLISEMFSCNIKAYATALCTTSLSVVGSVMLTLYPLLASASGTHVAFYFFAACTLVCMTFAFYLPETRGKSLSEIQDMLQGRSGLKFKKGKLDVIDGRAISEYFNYVEPDD